jgi:hypothetical protein
LHIEKERIMKNALRPAGDGLPLAGRKLAGPAAGLAASGPPQRASQRWKAFALLVVTYFIAIVDFTIVNVALTTIGRELRFPESDLQWLVTAWVGR